MGEQEREEDDDGGNVGTMAASSVSGIWHVRDVAAAASGAVWCWWSRQWPRRA